MSTTPDNQQPVPQQPAQDPPGQEQHAQAPVESAQQPVAQEPVRWEPAPQAQVPPRVPAQHVPEQQAPVHAPPAQQAPVQQAPVQQEPVQYTQSTTPLPEFARADAGNEFATEVPKSKNGGGLVAGLLVGALVGALVGGGTAAVVAHNVGGQTVVQGTQGGSLTLNNLDSATAITGVASVATPSVVTLQVFDGSVGGSGSGVIYSEDGYIITNAHVATLEGSTSNPSITVQTSDGVLYDGTLIGSDPFADIAVVKIDAEGLTPIAIADSDEINVGDLAVVIGAPLNLSNTVTSGVVSALDRGISVASSMVGEDDGGADQQEGPFPWFRFENPNEQQQNSAPASRVAIPVIQTDASINPGNSGGALLNANAELIGINVALASPTASSGAAGSDGLGFAVPVNLAVRVADALIAGERPSHGLIGVTQTAESSTANRAGGVIGEVTPGSPADKGGLRAGDVITSINGRMADSFTTVTALVRMHEGGEEITIGYNRNGEQREAAIVLDTLEW